ncbi:MAG TPA: hypothetical protein VHZ76_03300 [Gammaproteobacteria bacterium]|jgi:triphosphoribosyl-dephospho-CoA synthetase|nr:hypothetical protein [Gammaproteobacteria bacterium]
MINDLLLAVTKQEQEQELYEAIRHFTKYMVIHKVDDCFQVPIDTKKIQEDMIALYDKEFTVEKT